MASGYPNDWTTSAKRYGAFKIPSPDRHRTLDTSKRRRTLPEDLLQSYPDIPWHNIRGIGNFLRHAYSDIEPDILWEIVTDHLDPLDKAVQAMQKTIGEIR